MTPVESPKEKCCQGTIRPVSADGARWLYVSAFVPLENARHAGGRVAFENLRNLRQAHAGVDAVVCTTEPESVAPAPPGVQVFRQSGLGLAAYLVREARSLGLSRLQTAPVMHTRLQARAQRAIEDLMRRNSYAGLFADFTQSLLLVLRSAAAADCPAPLTVCVHDVFAQRLLRSNRPVEKWLTGAVMQDEQALLSATQQVLTLSEKDSHLVRSLYAVVNVKTKPFDPPAWCARVQRCPDRIDLTLLFFANFEREENSTAARWFVRGPLANVRLTLPHITLTLVGTGSDALANALAIKGVTGTGFLEDPSEQFSRCTLAIAPLFQGAGVKFKVLEALAAGVPVIGTPVALEGIDPRPALIAAPADRFASAIIEYLAAGSQR